MQFNRGRFRLQLIGFLYCNQIGELLFFPKTFWFCFVFDYFSRVFLFLIYLKKKNEVKSYST
jgi:hypothetical protein